MPDSSPVLLLHVATAWALPGLGLLALPQGPTPYLAAQPLHTALPVAVALPNGRQHAGQATVEEVSRPGEATSARGLLLDLGAVSELPAGTTVWLAQQ